MKGIIINFSSGTGGIKLESTTKEGKKIEKFYEVPRELNHIFDRVYQKGQEVNFTYEVREGKTYLKSFELLNLPKEASNEFTLANQRDKSYQERQEDREDLILKQTCGKIASELMKGVDTKMNTSEQLIAFKRFCKDIRLFMKSDWDKE